MTARVKLLRLMGAGMVTLAVVPWVGVSPAAATGNGNGGKAQKAAAAEHRSEDKKSAKQGGPAQANKAAAAKSQSKAKSKSEGKAKAKSQAKKQKAAKNDTRAANKAASGSKSKVNGDPPGFNGTVKIHDDETEPSPVQKNQPKVCDFHVHGFNFDGGASGTYWIEAHKWGGSPVESGAWTADAAGNWRTEVLTLPDGHYKLYADQTSPAAPGGQKHKVFKVSCAPETPGTPSTPETPGTPSTPETPGTPSTPETPGTPSTPETPGTPTTPVIPSTPGGPSSPGGGESGDTSVQPTKIGGGNGGAGANGGAGVGDTGVLGTKVGSGVLAATGISAGIALALSFALLVAGGALMVLPSRLAVERSRRH